MAASASAAPFEFAPLAPVAVSLEPAAAAAPAPPVPAIDVEAIRAEGFNDGYSAGVADARGTFEPAAAALEAAAAELHLLRGETAERSERAAVELAIAIAEKILQGALAAEPERVVDAVRGALRRLVERDRVLVLVHPDDLDVVREHAAGLVAELGGIEHCGVEADRRVGRGGAIVRTAEGEVDATLETKLDRAREVVESELAG
jgi:flagellar biosynthesis/type III secretory pathway protein FliH